MTFFNRVVTVLTVLLGLALMAVSVYAARTAPAAAAGSSWSDEPMSDVAAAAVEGESLSTVLPAAEDVGVTADGVSPARDRPPLRFAAPDVAAAAGLNIGPGDDLSTGVPVWSVASVPGGLLGAGNLGPAEIPPDQLVVMRQIGGAFGIPWQLLAAIARVESDFGRNMATSSAGAIGYGQFMPPEWARYGAGGDPYNYRDALLAMARYLRVAGAPENIPEAVYAYNHSWEYVELVLSYATRYGYLSSPSQTGMIWPAFGPISSYFSPSHPLGIDIDLTSTPGAPVFAAHDGIVLFAGGDPCCSYGRYVIVDGGGGIVTLYAHLEVLNVRQGQSVPQGTALGSSGCTGNCTGAHLHFEVIIDGARRDPLAYLPGGY
jgi:murein DD-endopeptidase MepM/ murein hydrolase activator NlpD